MSRSYRKTPVFGMTTSKSDKPGRKIDHRRYRHYYKDKIRHEEYDDIEPPNHKENPWNWPKDGKQYWPEAKTWNGGEYMRK
jgi:hypothetical protein